MQDLVRNMQDKGKNVLKCIGGGSILNVRGPRCKTVRARAQNFKPRPLISGNASMKYGENKETMMDNKQKNSRFQGGKQ